ncbi:MAG TPA: gliding motility-associated C-terminal domain-containing protein, partial [Saprospiraceae bacterium]|nr:gliding motility-associated C-terminal domain-containing protein [Saprospiraceae bacterium]
TAHASCGRNTTTYKASAYDENGCLAEDELTIYVHIKTTVYVPNSFSPDADGINDKWVIFADNTVKLIKTLHIYDRWGESIMQQENFPPNDPDYGWNGTFRRKPLDPAVFVYYFVVEYENGTTKVFKGDINIISKK